MFELKTLEWVFVLFTTWSVVGFPVQLLQS